MMHPGHFAVLLLWPLLLLPASMADDVMCPDPDHASLKIGGTTSFQMIARAWEPGFMNTTAVQEHCPQLDVEIGGYTWAIGASRVCDVHPYYDPLDMAGMSGRFFSPQARTSNGWKYDCKMRSDRKAILVDVGYEGLALATAKRGAAAECIELLGGSLSVEQLRWIFSNRVEEEELQELMPNTDNDLNTHLWSELHANCSQEEILMSWVDSEVGAHEYLLRRVLLGYKEDIDTRRGAHRAHETFQDLLNFLPPNDAAISFFQLGNLRSRILTEKSEQVAVIPIDYHGEGIPPEAETFQNGIYPLASVISVGVWDDPWSLRKTIPFIQFGFSEQGSEEMEDQGFWALDEWEKIIMQNRLQADGSIPLDQIRQNCGRGDGSITIAGSTTVFPVAQLWSEIYKLGCDVDITIEQGGSTDGAGRVCGNEERGRNVDIGNMSREWKSKEGLPRDDDLDHVYDCQKGDISLSVIQVDVARDALTVILKKGGIADQCQEILGGFTIDQLRWIYSGYSDLELEATGWDPRSIKNNDGSPYTHTWSELDPGCAAEEIRLAGNPTEHGTHASFVKTVMADHAQGEETDLLRPSGYYEAFGFDLVSYLQSHGEAIAYIGFSSYYANKELLSAASIENSVGQFVAPSAQTVGDGSYHPLVRGVSMNLVNDPDSLENTVPLLKFGYDHPELVTATGMVALQGEGLQEMLYRLDSALGGEVPPPSSGQSLSYVWGLVAGVAICSFLFHH